ncbi:MAG: glutamate-5-semialdehyde dehydrogenase, partial [Flavobacteriales bacterium]
MKLLQTDIKNKVLQSMMTILDSKREAIIAANKQDLDLFDKSDRAMYDRLIVNDKKVDGMIQSIKEVMQQEDPVGKIKSERILENDL